MLQGQFVTCHVAGILYWWDFKVSLRNLNRRGHLEDFRG